MRITFDLELPDALAVELERAAKRCGLRPETWAGLTIEAELASQRLPKVPAGRCGARVYEAEPALVEHRVVQPE